MSPKPRTDEEKLRFLGTRIQKGWSQTRPTSQRSVETMRKAVLQEQSVKQEMDRASPSFGNGRTISPKGPDLDR